MADSAETSNVFLDTEVFDCHQFALDALSFRRLVRLAAEDTVRVLLTTVTVGEIRKHIDQHAEKSFKQVESFRRILPATRKVITPDLHATLSGATVEQFRRSILEAFEAFLTDTKAVVLTVDGVSPEAVFRDYFAVNAPFGDGDKKSEFPDAFASAALRAWAESEGESVYVVSGDKDWRRVCQNQDALIHQGQLGELLEKFADSELVSYIRQAIGARRDEVKALLDAQAEDIYVFSLDGMEAEIEGPDEVDVTFEDFHVIEAKDGQATVSLFCALDFRVTVLDDDPDSSYTDPDNGERRSVWRRSGSIEGDAEMEATLTLQYDPAQPDQVTFEAVKFAKPEIEVGFEDHELTQETDGEDEDDYYQDEEPPDDYAEYEPPEEPDPPEYEEPPEEEPH